MRKRCSDGEPDGLAVLQFESPRGEIEKVSDARLPVGLQLDCKERFRREDFVGMDEAGRVEREAERVVFDPDAVARLAVAARERHEKIGVGVFVQGDRARLPMADHREVDAADDRRAFDFAIPLAGFELIDH